MYDPNSLAKEIIGMMEKNVSEADLAAYLLFVFEGRDNIRDHIDNTKWTDAIDSCSLKPSSLVSHCDWPDMYGERL